MKLQTYRHLPFFFSSLGRVKTRHNSLDLVLQFPPAEVLSLESRKLGINLHAGALGAALTSVPLGSQRVCVASLVNVS